MHRVAVWLVLTTACGSASQDPRPVAAEPSVTPAAEAPAEESLPTAAAASAAPEPEPASEVAEPTEPDPMSFDGSHSTSIGSPTNGRIDGAIQLPLEAKGIRHNPNRPRDARWGSVEMIQALMRAAALVADEMPGGQLTVNDVGLREGGPIDHHGSHQSGRDVDVLFYLFGPDGEPIPSVGAFLDLEGRGVDFKDLTDGSDDVHVRIDVRRTWRFVQALIEDEHVSINRIFVAEHVRNMLLEHAERARAPRRAIDRFGDMTCQPGYPHDDHFHFRFFCTAEDIARGCEDTSPIYPWHRQALAALGVEPVLARPRRRSREEERARAARITTHEEAEQQAERATRGRIHPAVRAWIRKREAWREPPRPGRQYCR